MLDTNQRICSKVWVDKILIKDCVQASDSKLDRHVTGIVSYSFSGDRIFFSRQAQNNNCCDRVDRDLKRNIQSI